MTPTATRRRSTAATFADGGGYGTLALTLGGTHRVEAEVELSDAVSTRFFSRIRTGAAGARSIRRGAVASTSGGRCGSYGRASAVDRGAGGAASLVSRASLERLAAETETGGPIDARRFRMLIEVDGLAAHEEDDWVGRSVRVGDAVIRWRGHVGRCVITSRDPDTGVVDLPTLNMLAAYRRRPRHHRAASVRDLRRGHLEAGVSRSGTRSRSTGRLPAMNEERVRIEIADHVATVTLIRGRQAQRP